MVITKTWPAADVRMLAGLGVTDVGENRDAEASPKAAALTAVRLRWHFVGQLQTNKARSVARYADVVESVDRVRLVSALERAASGTGRRLSCLVQVGLSREPGRGGADPGQVPEVAAAVAASSHLQLAGVMAVAPLGEDPIPAFSRLAEISARIRLDHFGATTVSAGMSEDFEAAIACGATHVRIGSAVLGHRPPVR